jgi:extradiol dioxygenase family protein
MCHVYSIFLDIKSLHTSFRKCLLYTTNSVDDKEVPAMHFGLVLEWNDWHQLKDKLEKKRVEFVLGPYTRYEDQPGSQATMFIVDPCGNHLEFKSFKDETAIFDSDW